MAALVEFGTMYRLSFRTISMPFPILVTPRAILILCTTIVASF